MTEQHQRVMADGCDVCSHAAREAIESALIEGESVPNVAQRYGLSPSWMEQHRREHLSVEQRAQLEETETTRGTPYWQGMPWPPPDLITQFRGAYPH